MENVENKVVRSYIYIAGPYSGSEQHGTNGYMNIEQHILNARLAMSELVNLGYGVFCPHTHSAHFEVITPDVSISYWYSLDLYFLQFCHALFRLEGKSFGADKEVQFCLDRNIPVFYTLDTLKKDVPVFRPHVDFLRNFLQDFRTGKI